MNNVILVNSLFNLMTAIQLRRKILTDSPVDIVLSTHAKGLREIYQSRKLESIFDKVFFADYCGLDSHIERIKGVINPNYIIHKLTGYNFIPYTDIYFWNPTHFLHFYLFEAEKRGLNVNLHVYGDAMGGFFMDVPLDRGIFGRNSLNKLIYKYYNYAPLDRVNYDYYEYEPQYITFETHREIKKIPGFAGDLEIINIFNSIFDFDEEEIQEPVIILDFNQDDHFRNSTRGLDFIKHITQVIDQDITLKPHPRQNLEVYKKMDVKLCKLRCPWELYCLNYSIDRKLIISFSSSSSLTPYILCNSVYRLIFIDLENDLSDYFDGKWEKIINKLKATGRRISYIRNVEEFDKAVVE